MSAKNVENITMISKNYLISSLKGSFNLLLLYSHLSLFCFLGVWLRFFLVSNFTFSHALLDKDIYANALGCFIISFVSEFKTPLLKLSESEIYEKSLTRILTG